MYILLKTEILAHFKKRSKIFWTLLAHFIIFFIFTQNKKILKNVLYSPQNRNF